MKKKRIILHIVILGLSLISLSLVSFSVFTFQNKKLQNTKEALQSRYEYGYLDCIQSVLSQMNDQVKENKTQELGKDVYTIYDDVKFVIFVPDKNGKSQEYTNVDKGVNIYDNSKYVNVIRYVNEEFSMSHDSNYEFMQDNYEFKQEMSNIFNEQGENKQLNQYVKENGIKIAIGIKNDGIGHFANLNKQIENAVTEAQKEKVISNIIVLIAIAGAMVVLALVPFIILLIDAGHRNKGDVAETSPFDKAWLDVIIVGGMIIYIIIICIMSDIFGASVVPIELWIAMFIFVGLTAVEIALFLSESLARRIKNRTFIRTTLIGKICCQIIKMLKELLKHINITAKVILTMVIGIFLQIIQIFNMQNNGGFLGLCIFNIAPILIICYILWKYLKEKEILSDGAARIAQGDVNYKIQELTKFNSNTQLKENINSIGNGLNVAVQSSVKNEKMKTELITNVSHDLKTPLTSIINYIDLLKTDGLDGPKAKEYLNVLDAKSQRLKTLTEDLVEASKLNSGVVEFNMEKIDVVQLVNQSLGEYNEKFARKRLEIVKKFADEHIFVKADGRKTWRAFDNLYGNIYKYAMPGTRVYINIDSNAKVSIKNISEGPLNFSADELTERFVRGDVSRSTEGSGLGLSITRTIIERQGGEMIIVLDGDLFKVEITFNIVKQGNNFR